MSFTFTPPFGALSPVQYGVDLALTKPYPGVFLNGQEPNGALVAQQEISGALWTISNGYWNGASFVPLNTALASFAMVKDGQGNLFLYESILVNNAAQNPLVWVQTFKLDANGTIIASGNINLPTTGIFGNIVCQNITVSGAISGNIGVGAISNLAFIRAGSQGSVPCDGSATTALTFSTPFPNTIQGVPIVSIGGVSNAGQAVGTPQVSAQSVNGFSVFLAGAAAGTTCTLTYWANGT